MFMLNFILEQIAIYKYIKSVYVAHKKRFCVFEIVTSGAGPKVVRTERGRRSK